MASGVMRWRLPFFHKGSLEEACSQQALMVALKFQGNKWRSWAAIILISLDNLIWMLIIPSNLSKRRLSGRKEEDSISGDCSCIASLRVFHISAKISADPPAYC